MCLVKRAVHGQASHYAASQHHFAPLLTCVAQGEQQLLGGDAGAAAPANKDGDHERDDGCSAGKHPQASSVQMASSKASNMYAAKVHAGLLG